MQVTRGLVRAGNRVPWWLAILALALAFRLGYLFLADEPLLYSHQYTYFQGGLSIAEHPNPWQFVLRSDKWRTWGAYWTIAPLYYLLLAAVFKVVGPQLVVVLVLQCLLDSIAAVMVGVLGRAVVGRHGAWAGAVYAVHWPAIELCGYTMTENVHTVLLMAGFAVLASGAAGRETGLTWRRALAAGFLLGLSALVRAVGLVFLPLAALWHLRLTGVRRGGPVAISLLLGAGAAVLPWTARNVLIMGDPSLIETVSTYNLWTDYSFVDDERYARQEVLIGAEKTPAARRARATTFAWRGFLRSPQAFPPKVWANLKHILRPEELQILFAVEEPRPTWKHLTGLLLDDAILLVTLPLFTLFLLAGPPSAVRWLIGLWTSYYLFMIVVVFHNDVRYRSALMPFAFAGAMGGLAMLASPDERRRWRARAALAFGVLVCVWMVHPYVIPAWRAARASWILRPAAAAVARGDLADAESRVRAAAQANPKSARPWVTYGRWLAAAGRFPEAVQAQRRAQAQNAHQWIPSVVLPRLLQETGQLADATAALGSADDFSRHADPWLALEVAWRELPPPRGSEVLLARGDYGAVRGFFHPLGDSRWSRRHAVLRLIPSVKAPAYRVTLDMASPTPSPVPHPEVQVRISGGAAARFTLGPEVLPYSFLTPAPPGEVVYVQLESPTWSRAGLPAEQGVRVYRLTVVPAP